MSVFVQKITHQQRSSVYRICSVNYLARSCVCLQQRRDRTRNAKLHIHSVCSDDGVAALKNVRTSHISRYHGKNKLSYLDLVEGTKVYR